MDTKDILRATQSTERLIQDDNYYKYIFKKTERIVSVVFYITQSLSDSASNQRHIEDIEHAARLLHDAVLASLQSRAHVAEDSVRETVHALIVLESKLRVAQVAGLITPEVMHVIGNETDAVLRGASAYLGDEPIIIEREEPAPRRGGGSRSSRVSAPRAESSAAASAAPVSATPAADDRRARIKAIISSRGEVTIKDISSVITDISEKTIQRELNAMIEDNEIKRIGEKRWSRYVTF